MVFSSVTFLYYFLPVTLALYFLSPRRLRNLILFLLSLLFYAWGEPLYIFIMLFSTAFDYANGLALERFWGRPRLMRLILMISIVGNLLILGIFKYLDFVLMNLNALFNISLPLPGLLLPIGISFYTFQTMSYTIDVYRGKIPVQRDIIAFGAYVTLFPQLIAGPIVRYATIAKELNERRESADEFSAGIARFCSGLAKKVLIANNVGALWDIMSAAPQGELSVLSAWLGIVAYALQIYFDFSGYSDMAIGLGRMLGFHFLENFNYPYISRSVTEFWRRWHISLGSWFREYLYIPLGGNRAGTFKTLRNIFVVWLLTGLWHGASWTFVLWGVYYGLLLLIEKSFLLSLLDRAPKLVGHVYTLFCVLIGWVLFASVDLGAAWAYLGAMLGAGASSLVDATALYNLLSYLPVMVIAAVGSTPLPLALANRAFLGRGVFLKPALAMAALFLATAYLVDSSYNPFLYFRF